MAENNSQIKAFPFFGYLGLLLLLTFWYINWHLEDTRTHWAFFPMWLGFILFLNGLSYKRKGTCLLTRSWKQFILLFILSAPMWWIFEFFNERVEYWVYLPQDWLPRCAYILFATINFSTVLPGIFSASEWINSFSFFTQKRKFIRYGAKSYHVVVFFILGWVMLAITFLYPQYSMAFIWMSLFFILDPINYWLGYDSILKRTAIGDWNLVWVLWIGSLVCGFAWELWNYYSWPKWIYQVPYVDFWYVFEMPLLGYLGYLPFALELYAMYALVVGIFKLEQLFPHP